MFKKLIVRTTKNCYDDNGIAAAIIAAILCLGLAFGIYCGLSALFMVCWNGAVVPAITVCNPLGFWQSMVFIFAGDFFFALALPNHSKDDDDDF